MDEQPDRVRRIPEFDKSKMIKSVIAIPLQEALKKGAGPYEVIIDTNLLFAGGRAEARARLIEMVKEACATGKNSHLHAIKTQYNQQYVFATLELPVLHKLLELDGWGSLAGEDGDTETGPAAVPVVEPVKKKAEDHVIYKVRPDFDISALIYNSIRTVKADAAKSSFSAKGKGITWAVLDSGIDKNHIQFNIPRKKTGDGEPELENTLDTGLDEDFTTDGMLPGDPFLDEYGHGTHVAGIIAGEYMSGSKSLVKKQGIDNKAEFEQVAFEEIAGMAPQCKLVSLKVLDSNGAGKASNIIAAINYIQEKNGYGRNLKIHGVNISIGHPFNPEWFACGQSPLCVEINRLVKSGVVVVVAAGNSGFGYLQTMNNPKYASGLGLSINDPGNAELAITVGSTHRDMPHIYGVSYFSSKGPTGDGRLKPDLVAPGERIVSCLSAAKKMSMGNVDPEIAYIEDSGTSMAAPHVSGVIAAFLSVRKEFIGQPEQVKEIFTSTATDLKRDRNFQGHGLIDLMRAIQSV